MDLHPIEIPALGESVREARAAVGKVLADWGCHGAADDTLLCLSEVVTNAIRHGGPCGTVPVCISLDGVVRVEVTDGNTECALPTVPVAPSEDVETGRGLFLVTALSHRWGVAQKQPGTKVVWFEVRVEPDPEPGP